MPILHVQYDGQGHDLNGQPVRIAPQLALVQRGPCIQVTIGLSESIARQLVQQGEQVPNEIAGYGLIDTGASSTCIDDALAQQLGFPVIDVVQMTSASHANTEANVYPIQLEIIGPGIRVNVPRSLGASLQPQGLVALIGRDFLQHCALTFNGFAGQVTLSI